MSNTSTLLAAIDKTVTSGVNTLLYHSHRSDAARPPSSKFEVVVTKNGTDILNSPTFYHLPYVKSEVDDDEDTILVVEVSEDEFIATVWYEDSVVSVGGSYQGMKQGVFVHRVIQQVVSSLSVVATVDEEIRKSIQKILPEMLTI